MSLQGSLLLSSIVALVTTEPPSGALMDYTTRWAYMCLWAAFGVLLGGVIVAAVDVYIMATCYTPWVRDVSNFCQTH